MSDAVYPPDTPAYRAAGAAQAEAADPAVSAWVAANAGSGKTKVLIDRVARLLLGGAPPDSILCITYTRAAANEMVDRLFARLGDWSVMDEAGLREKLAQLEGRTASDYSGDQLRRARALFAKALETPGGLRIETIHAFCARILRRFPLEAGVSPGFAEIEETEEAALRKRALDHAVLTADPADRDLVALEAGGLGADAPLMALVRAGDRVTDFLTRQGGDAEAVTARVRAAVGAPDRSSTSILEDAMGEELPRNLLREAADALAVAGGKSEVAAADALVATLAAETPQARFDAYRPLWRTAAGTLRKSNPYNKKTGEAAPFLVDAFQIKEGEGTEIARMLAVERALVAARCAERTLALLRLGRVAVGRFAALKTQRAALDFDDLIARVRALLTEAEMADWVRFKLDGGLTHLLLDEAQDTSPSQWEIVDALTEEFFAGDGVERSQDPRTLFVVGDEKQSIYAFQGADPDGFLRGRQAFVLKPGETRTPDMAMSFRSTADVLGFVDEVFVTDAFDGHPFAMNPPPEADAMRHDARRAGQRGRVELWPVQPKVDLADADPWDAPVDSLAASSPKAALARTLAEGVRAMIDRGEAVWTEGVGGAWSRRPTTPGDVMILVRGRTGGLFDAIIDALKRVGLPVAGADRLILADHIGVQDCLNLMRFALLPTDDLTLAEILRGPFCDLVDDDIHLFPL
ncbi:MAG: UvrD-helicase domain-containing protein, partial [Pseudomonadota bacterium]